MGGLAEKFFSGEFFFFFGDVGFGLVGERTVDRVGLVVGDWEEEGGGVSVVSVTPVCVSPSFGGAQRD